MPSHPTLTGGSLAALTHWQVEGGWEAAREDRNLADADEVSWVDSPRGLEGGGFFPRPFQVDPKITRPQLVSAHTKWLYCSSAFWVLGGQCETRQRFVPDGYWFETGRSVPDGTNCSALTGDGDVSVVSCRFKRGLRMVLPVVNVIYYACSDADGSLEDPRLGPQALQSAIPLISILKLTLDNGTVDFRDALNVVTQDGDGDYTYPTVRDRCVQSSQVNFPFLGGCPLYAAGPYVFIDTKNLTKGTHELVMIGKDDFLGGCSAVKHIFTLY
jgi:hypothetical protein